jgi:hypothetical protein
MSTQAIQENMQLFIGYFEEPEPGVPDGCTGWYHSAGRFPVRSAGQVFANADNRGRIIREEVAGPFPCQAEALADLRQGMDG